MNDIRYLTRCLVASLALPLVGLVACSDGDTPVAPKPVLTQISVEVPLATLEIGELTTAIAVGLDQDGQPLTIGPVEWTSETPTVAAANPASGRLFGIGAGTTRIIATFEGKTGERTITVAAAPAIRINEVQPKAGAPGGFVEFFNPTSAAVDMSGWTLVGNDFFGPEFKFPAGSVIQPNAFLVVDEDASLPFRLEAPDNLHLFSKFGVQVDGVNVGLQPATTFGRCPDGTAAFITTTAATKGTRNACP